MHASKLLALGISGVSDLTNGPIGYWLPVCIMASEIPKYFSGTSIRTHFAALTLAVLVASLEQSPRAPDKPANKEIEMKKLPAILTSILVVCGFAISLHAQTASDEKVAKQTLKYVEQGSAAYLDQDYKNAIKTIPDPASDSSFSRYRTNEKFRRLLEDISTP